METTKRNKQFEALQTINTKTFQHNLETADLDELFKKEQIKTAKDYKKILIREQ